MKTRLLLFFLVLFSTFSIAQVGIFEGFESGIPATWTNVGASIQSTSGQAETGTQFIQMGISLGSSASLLTSNYTSDGTAITLSIKYKKFAGAFGSVGLRYYANGSGTPIDISSASLFTSESPGYQYQTLTGSIAAGNITSGMTVRFELYVWGQGGSNTAIFFDNFTAYQQNSLLTPTITVNPVNIGTTTASISYGVVANSLSATSVIKYGILNTNLSSTAAGFTAIGTNVMSSSATLTGLSVNTLYYYQIEATNSRGTSQSVIGSFTTATPATQLITEYNFNNTYNNVNGSAPFSSSSGTSFVTGRDGVTANGAININNSNATVATIPSLPIGNASRSISVWAKTNSFLSGGYNFIFSYGQESGAGTAQAGSFTQSDVSYLGYFTNLFTNTTITQAVSIWYHFVYVYDGTTAYIYRNGILIRSSTITWSTLNNNNIFKLGVSFGGTSGFNGAIDDLKIYNYALSQSEVTNLFNNNTTLSSSNFNQNNLQVAVYPNPANNILNVEVATDLKSIEIYNIQGQKVMSSTQKQLNITDLQAGIYMIKIEDTENAVATKKFVKQ